MLRMKASADGWRGVIGESFSTEQVGVLAGCTVSCVTPATVLVSYDGRRGGTEAATAAARGAVEAGAEQVVVVPHLPTPTATAAVRLGDADLGLLVTASHNPPRWNGLKVKAKPGCPLSRALEVEVDALFDARLGAGADYGRSAGPGRPRVRWESRDAFVDRHIADVLSRMPDLRSRSLTVTVDGLGGVAGDPAARLCERLGWRVRRVACSPDPEFGGVTPDPSVAASRGRAVGHGTDLGVVLDGDGDRLYVLDHLGRTVQPHELFALLLEHRARLGVSSNGIAVTSSTGAAVREVARRMGIPVHETGVGFKHLSPLLLDRQVDAAGGSVGDLNFAEFGLDRDPFATLVLLADLLASADAPLAELLDDLHARVGHLVWFESMVDSDAVDLRQPGVRALRRNGLRPDEITTVDGTKFCLPDGEWLLLRRSTTQVGVRIYGELIDARAVSGVLRSVRDELMADRSVGE
jgi:phosphomannomutase